MIKNLTVAYEEYAHYSELNEIDQRLLQKANEIVEDAYAPYSNFKVGASVLLENGEIILGSNQENIYTITGSLFIPGLYGDTIKALPKLKSIDALKKIATDLKLGFATNEESTNDEMTWINPNSTVANFIKNITDRAYKNETSFFTSFIDVNYILNFINVDEDVKENINDYQVDDFELHNYISHESIKVAMVA